MHSAHNIRLTKLLFILQKKRRESNFLTNKIRALIHTMNNRHKENVKIFSFLSQKQGKQTNFKTDIIRTSIHITPNRSIDKDNIRNLIL